MFLTPVRTLFLGGALVLVIVSFPAVFLAQTVGVESVRATTDALALLIGYAAVALLWGTVRLSGGRMRRALLWLVVGMSALAGSFLLGPVLQYYNLVGWEVMMVVRALLMLVAVSGVGLFSYWFYTIIAPPVVRWESLWLYVVAMLAASLVFISQIFHDRSFSESVIFTVLGISLLVIAGATAAAVRACMMTGSGYYRFLVVYLAALISFLCALIISPLATPNALVTAIQGSVAYQVALVLVATCFLVAVLHIRRLEIFAPAQLIDGNTRV